jgi:hypothetical protein
LFVCSTAVATLVAMTAAALVPQLAMGSLARVVGSLGLVGLATLVVRWLRRRFDYMDFVSSNQFQMDAGKICNVHSCIVLAHAPRGGGGGRATTAPGPQSFAEIVRRFRAAYIGEAGQPVKPQFARFLSVGCESPVLWPYWRTPQQVPALREGYHFVEHAQSVPWAGLEAWIVDSLSVPLDTSCPLWQLHFWPRVGTHGHSVFMLKCHHCVADGFSTLRAVLTACDRLDGRLIADGNPRPLSAANEPDADAVRRRRAGSSPTRGRKPGPCSQLLGLASSANKLLVQPSDPVGVLKRPTAASDRCAGANWPSSAVEADNGEVSVEWLKRIGRSSPVAGEQIAPPPPPPPARALI